MSILSLDGTLAFKNISIYKLNATTLRITGLSQEKTAIAIYTLLGKKILNTSVTTKGIKDINVQNFSRGDYLVQLKNNLGKLNKKIFLE